MTAIKVTFKQSGDTQFFKSCAELFKQHSSKELGICLAALWNALSPSKGKERYENDNIIIERTSFKNWQ
ncbi:MAG: hypothetical protein IKZ87_09120 [Actinomycetaceae bacterium]|nr:hypothetical protein [Actinomycetaceae bacterium]